MRARPLSAMFPRMATRFATPAALALALCALASCHKSQTLTGANGFTLLVGDCDPLVPSHCGLPFPSNVWRVQDETTKLYKLHFGATTLPNLAGAQKTDPTLWENRDGFSSTAALLAQLSSVPADGLSDENHLADTVLSTSPTILMNAVTGELIPHIAEVDAWAQTDEQRLLILRPVQRLADGTRYIAAVRQMHDATGALIPPSPAFLALRDQGASTDGSVELRRDLYEDIFTQLAAHGVARADLQLAWDFTTASTANTQTDLLSMRDQALAAVGDDGPTYVITSIETNPNPYIAQRIHGTMTVPFFISSTDESGTMVRDANGLPTLNGTATFDFLVHVPNSCATGHACAVIQNGHGLLGDLTEGEDSYLAQFAEQFHYVALAVDWWGFDSLDLGQVVTSVVDDVGAFPTLVEHQEQGMINNLLAMRMMKGRFAREPAVQAGGESVYDPSLLFYRGDSQGGIFGATYMSISTDVTRGLLGEPGMPYNLLLDRSVDFQEYRSLLDNSLPDARDEQLYLNLIQQFWDRVEPSGYAPMLAAGDSKTPAHRVLIHAAIGDHQVTTLGAHVLARALGASNLSPVNREIFGISDATGPLDAGSTLVEFSFGLPPVPTANLPPVGAQYGDDPHDTLRTEPDAQQMADTFFRTGTVVQTCDGACDPE